MTLFDSKDFLEMSVAVQGLVNSSPGFPVQ